MPEKMADARQVYIDPESVQFEVKREGAKLLIPIPDQKPDEIDFITLLGGRRSNMYKLFQVRVAEKGLVAMAEHPPRKITMAEIQECAEYILMHSTSLDGFRSKQIVEILKSETKEPTQSLLDKAMNRFKRG